MKATGFFFLFFLWQTSFSQWTEDFADGDFTQNPAWAGDTALFTVTAAALQLNAPAVSGTAFLATPSTTINDATWAFRVRMAFNPSGSNYSKIYLVADRENLNGSLNGYFVKLGGTPDEVSLYRQEGLTAVKIIDGLDGRLSLSNVDVQVQVSRTASGNWLLSSRLATETTWVTEGTVTDATYFTSAYFGVSCIYTATRSTRFYFDDIAVTGSAYVDMQPPAIDTVMATDEYTLLLRFNEAIDTLSAANTANYLLNNTESPASLGVADSSISLTFTNNLAVLNALWVSGIKDLALNLMADTMLQVVYVSSAPVRYGDVVINEIMADPTPREDLPGTEYLELFNASNRAIDMTGWSLKDKVSTAIVPGIILLPDSLLILSSASGAPLLAPYGQALGLSPWPSLNNNGDSIYLLNSSAQLMDLVVYDKDWYADNSKTEGGWSLERINPYHPCSGYLNWQAAVALQGGSPGQQNSVLAATDTVPPVILNHQVLPSSIVITFNEPLRDTLGSANIEPPNALQQVTIDYNQLTLSFIQPFIPEQTNTLTIGYLADCFANGQTGLEVRFVPDFAPPQIDTVYANYPQTIAVRFNEPVLNPATGNFSLVSVGPPESISVDPDSSRWVVLFFSQPLVTGNNYTLVVDSLADKFNNMTNQSFYGFVYQPLGYPQFGEVLITEIMADPSPPVNLPEEEYLELVNRSGKRLLLQGLTLADSRTETVLPDGIIGPGERVILCKASAVTLFTGYGKTIGIPNWPSLNNRADQLVLFDTSRQVIHDVAYDETWYDDEDKTDGGWSLEMMDENTFCGGDKVWAASRSVTGGTPGAANSRAQNLADLVIPTIAQARALSPDSVLITYDEQLSPQLPLFSIRSGTINSAAFRGVNRQEVLLLVDPLQPRVVYEITAANTTDCAGNLNPAETVTLTLPEEAAPGEVVVSEVLFNPREAGVDFIEVYNNSPKYISLQNWQIRNGRSATNITNQPLLPPYTYRVFTSDRLRILMQYPNAVAENIFFQEIPALANTAGEVVLINRERNTLDSIRYDENWHFPYLSDVAGVSLERTNLSRPAYTANNWASAAGSENYGTPGYQNSQVSGLPPASPVSVNPSVISPNADGRDDFTSISFNPATPGRLATIIIYNIRGQPIKEIANNALVGNNTLFTWDGTDGSGSVVPLGHYLVVIETIDSQGNTQRLREKVVVATGF